MTALAVASALAGSACTAAEGDARVDVQLPGPTPTAELRYESLLRFDFDGTDGPMIEGWPVQDVSGAGHAGMVRLAGTATQPLVPVAGGETGDVAIEFPAPCTDNGLECPKAVIEVLDSPALNPGDRDFRFGASVRLEPSQTSRGENIIQKGFSNGGGSQWKLQVDGAKGRPSCVLVGRGDDVLHEALANASVADGLWHDVACVRKGSSLTVEVDGDAEGSTTVPVGLAIAPAGPMRLGGKNVKPDNDQFFGALDDVFFEAAVE